jgi:D-arabinose 5-phosphate isomerase GutQ
MEISNEKLIKTGRLALQREGEAILSLQQQLESSFSEAVQMILECQGHVIVAGAGTSSAVARRMVHLLTCSGAPAFYLGLDESAHGEAAAVTRRDVLIAISKSGETDELNHLVRFARQQGASVIGLTGQDRSTMAEMCHCLVRFVTPLEVEGEGVIALGSSLAACAIGDAICAAILSVRGFNPDFFRQVHPGGLVGRQLSNAGQ